MMAFSDRLHEQAFTHSFQASRLQQDGFSLLTTPPLFLLAAVRPLLSREWFVVAVDLAEAAAITAILLVLRARPATYIRRRSLLMALVMVGHCAVRVRCAPPACVTGSWMCTLQVCKIGLPIAADHALQDAG